MKLSENTQYICLIPPPVEEPVRPADEHKQDESSPAQSWSLLQPLSGSCLYVRVHIACLIDSLSNSHYNYYPLLA